MTSDLDLAEALHDLLTHLEDNTTECLAVDHCHTTGALWTITFGHRIDFDDGEDEGGCPDTHPCVHAWTAIEHVLAAATRLDHAGYAIDTTPTSRPPLVPGHALRFTIAGSTSASSSLAPCDPRDVLDQLAGRHDLPPAA